MLNTLLSDYDKKNEFDIEKYVKNRNRLRIKRDEMWWIRYAMSEKSQLNFWTL